MLASFFAVAEAVLPAEGGGGFQPFQFSFGVTFWTILIFVLALIPMWKLVFGPILRSLSDRDQRVVDAAEAAEKAKIEAEQAVAAAKAELEAARTESRKSVDEAMARAERQGEEALRTAKAEADRQLAKAREEIDASKQKALQDVRQEVVQMSVASARQILKKELDTATHQQLVDDFIQRFQGNN